VATSLHRQVRHLDRSIPDLQKTANEVKEGALAAAARPQEGEKLAVADRQRYVVERQHRPAPRRTILMADPVDDDVRRAAQPLLFSIQVWAEPSFRRLCAFWLPRSATDRRI